MQMGGNEDQMVDLDTRFHVRALAILHKLEIRNGPFHMPLVPNRGWSTTNYDMAMFLS